MKRIWFMFVAVAAAVVPAVLAQVPVPQPPAPVEIIYTPDSSVKFALADLLTIPPEVQPNIRYLSLYNIPRDKRPLVAKIVSFAVNSLGTRRQIFIPVFVGGSDNTVIRININDYEWNAADFDKLGREGSGVRPFPDPYFHFVESVILQGKPGGPAPVAAPKTEKKIIKTTKEVTKDKLVFTGRYDPYRRPIYENRPVKELVEVEETIEVPVQQTNASVVKTSGSTTVKRKVSAAPWLDTGAIAQLIKLTQAESPILRADWFIVNSLVPPAYHDFLRLGNNIKDFERLIFTDLKLAEQARSQDKAVIIQSMVARNNRTLTRSPTFTNGYYWASHDSLKSIDDRKYILNFLNEQFDATEDIGTLPNGLQAYFLTDGAGNRVDFANVDVAVDNTAVDRTVRNGRSCIICHGEGIKPIEDEIRTLNRKLQDIESIRLLSFNEKDAYRILDLFGSNIDKQIVKDQNLYNEAVAATNGLDGPTNAKTYAQIYDAYAEHLLSKETVALDLGVNLAELEQLIRLSDDPVVLGLIKEPIRPVRRDQWEESFGRFMLVILGAKVAPQAPQAKPPPAVPVYQP